MSASMFALDRSDPSPTSSRVRSSLTTTHDLITPVLPRSGKGRSEAAEARYQGERQACFAARLDLASTLAFQLGTRGRCYLLEHAGTADKGQCDIVERLFTEGRTSGVLPLAIRAEESARAFDGLEELDETTPEAAVGDVIDDVETAHERYTPVSLYRDRHNFTFHLTA